ncbi:DNA polymerase-like [Amaranthus tricolor]|uniref:DNA polymerase-like n=1 Tax=Amaranthus tricolor TaxID=29722 RepID=UPI00258DBD9B|nr:DNA polymerase-like [Amaranthus tricolor]
MTNPERELSHKSTASGTAARPEEIPSLSARRGTLEKPRPALSQSPFSIIHCPLSSPDPPPASPPAFQRISVLPVPAADICSEIYANKNPRVRTVYFQNFARFDGIFILRYYADRGKEYKIKTLMRNHKIYELKVYIGGKFLLRFRDSCTLLPSSLESLGKTLCPELGAKGSIPHSELEVSNLQGHSEDLINYLRQDILILGGVMLKAQKIYWDKYNIDIEEMMTLSSLSLKIFRNNYLDDESFHIHLPTRNQDTFIRRGYYGGHSDVYKPYGENLYYYDVNSLYPYIMKEYPMPCGIPVWKKNLESVELDSLFGFIEAYVVCPTNISCPFLPYKDKAGTLLFPTGKFVGVFYSEELKFARHLGYHIMPLRGYFFEKKASGWR